MSYDMTREQADAALMASNPQDSYVQVDLDLSNGIVRSSKEMMLNQYDPDDVDNRDKRGYMILHEIDGTIVCFTHEQAIEVLMGERDPWDGEVVPDLRSKAEDIVDKVLTMLWQKVEYGTEFRDMDEGEQEDIFQAIADEVEEML